MDSKKTLTLRDILPKHSIETIMERGYDPEGEDILLGYCKWDGQNLIPLDGDSYSLDVEVLSYEYETDGTLVFWTPVTWLAPN